MKMKSCTRDAYRLIHDGALALAQVESNGIRVDTKYLDKTIQETDQRIAALKTELTDDKVFAQWKKRFGSKTTMGNRKQLGTIVFDVLGFERKSENNDESAFEGIDLPFLKNYIKLEKLKKVRGTYLGGIRDALDYDGFVRPFFNLHTVKTYRSSSDSPNFQNMPIRNEEMGKLIRSCFIPRDGHCMVELDFSGIEVRIAACYHKDPTMISYIEDKTKDMHRDMAAQCFMVKPGEVTKQMRYCGKNMFVFPQFYGDYYVNCARSMWEACDMMNLEFNGANLREHLIEQGCHELGDLDPEEKPRKHTFERHMQGVENDFWKKRFPVYDQWKRDWFTRYQKEGGFSMKTGFRVNGIWRRNEVINCPVQGAAFHCLLQCLILIQRRLNELGMKSKIVGQIHDSIVGDIHLDELDYFLTYAKKVMTKLLPQMWKWIIVPIEIEAEVAPPGASWYEKKQIQL